MKAVYSTLSGCLFVILFIVATTAQATHLVGGQLSYYSDTTATHNPLRYFFKLVTYQDGNSVPDSPEATLELGDGVSHTSARVSKTPISNACGFVFQNTYFFEHTFPGPGTYTAVYRDLNRGKNIVNLSQSDLQSFAIKAEIQIDLFATGITRNQLLIPPLFCANQNQPFYQSVAASHQVDDSLVYELVTPLKRDTDAGSPLQNVSGYQIPGKVHLNARTGEFTWKNPEQLGSFVFAIRVKTYRNNRFMGSIMRDFLVNVLPDAGVTQQFTVENRPELSITDENKILMTIGQPLTIKLKYDTNGQANHIMLFSEILTKSGNYSLDTVSAEGVITATLTLNPEENWRRNQPYLLVFRGTTLYNNVLYQQDFTIALYSNPKTISGGQGPGGEPSYSGNGLFILYPNPASDFIRIKNQNQIGRTRLLIYDTQAKLVLTQDLTTGITPITLPSIAAGLYLYQIQSETRQTLQTGKLHLE